VGASCPHFNFNEGEAMANSTIEVCNLALGFIKGGRITAFDGSSEEARQCELFYTASRDQVFEEHNWNCLKNRTVLSPDATPPAYGYTNRFLLPADPYCLRVISVADASLTVITDYVIEGRYILANTTQINLEYVGLSTDVTIYSATLTVCIARRLSANMAFALTGSSSAVQLAEDQYRKTIDQARSLDSSNGATGATYVDNGYFVGILS
jgi:hypothetical protein